MLHGTQRVVALCIGVAALIMAFHECRGALRAPHFSFLVFQMQIHVTPLVYSSTTVHTLLVYS